MAGDTAEQTIDIRNMKRSFTINSWTYKDFENCPACVLAPPPRSDQMKLELETAALKFIC